MKPRLKTLIALQKQALKASPPRSRDRVRRRLKVLQVAELLRREQGRMKISHRTTPKGDHEAIIELRWYAQIGTYLIEAVGYGNSPDAAETSARLLLGQARAELNEVTSMESLAAAMGENV